MYILSKLTCFAIPVPWRVSLHGASGMHFRHAAAHLPPPARCVRAARARPTGGTHRRAAAPAAHPEGVLLPWVHLQHLTVDCRQSDWAGFCSPTEPNLWLNGGHLGVITVDLMTEMGSTPYKKMTKRRPFRCNYHRQHTHQKTLFNTVGHLGLITVDLVTGNVL